MSRKVYTASKNTASSVVSLISREEALQAVGPAVETITNMIKTFLREIIHTETKLAVAPVCNPLEAVVLGARAMLPIVAMLNMWKR